MSAGRRDTLVTLDRFIATQASSGQQVETWSDVGQEWAAVYWGRGDERRQAASEQGSQAATFQMLSNELTRSLTLTDRITGEAGVFDVVSIAPDVPRRGLIEITAVRRL